MGVKKREKRFVDRAEYETFIKNVDEVMRMKQNGNG